MAIESDKTILQFVDRNQKPRLRLIVAKEGSAVGVLNEDGESQAVMAAIDSTPSLGLLDKGQPRVDLVIHDGKPALILRDAEGKDRLILEVAEEGPALRLKDENETTLGTLSLTKDGSTMILRDENGEELLSVP